MTRRVARARFRPRRLLATALIFTLLSPFSVFANDSTQTAEQHFSRGLAAAGSGKMTLAASEFERAYDTAPHYSVLYNLGLVYAALGRNADAVRVLRRYLRDGGEKISASRRAEVDAILRARSSGLGRARVVGAPEGGAVMLDARKLRPSDLAEPVELDPGPHLLVVERDGYRTRLQRFEVTPGAELVLEAALEPSVPSAPPENKVAVFVDCAVPDAELSIDEVAVSAPQRDFPLLVSEGSHVVRFSRAGYASDPQSVTASHGQLIRCRMRALAPLPPEVSGALRVEAPLGSQVLVDGVRFAGSALPSGRHRVTILADGYVPWHGDISIQAGATKELDPELEPTSERRFRDDATKTRKTWALVAGIGGGALLASGVVVYLVNDSRYEEWKADSDALRDDQDASAADVQKRSQTLQTRVAGIQQMDDVALGLAALGVVSLGVGLGLYLTIPGEPTGIRSEVGLSARGVEWSGAW